MAASSPASTGVVVRTLVCIFGCAAISLFAYGFAADRFYSCLDIHNRWMLAEFYSLLVNLGVISTWVCYKEPKWIVAAVLTVLITFETCVATCIYIIIQFLKLSPEEFSKDPLYYLLVKRQKRDESRQTRGLSIATAKVIFSIVGCLLLGIIIYLFVVDGSPLRASVFSPCMITTVMDFYVTLAIFSLWIAYKESSWISTFFWILLLACFGGLMQRLFGPNIGTCAYIVRQLSSLSPDQPVSLIIFNKNHRDLLSSDPLLVAHENV